MALFWAAKAPDDIAERKWVVPVADGDGVASYTVSVSGATIDADEQNGDVIEITLSAGTLGETATITLSATTNNGLTLSETAYLPIRPTANAFAYTVADVLRFALRPITGLGATATADELEDARENLDDMLASWAGMGAGLNVDLPTATADVLYIPDAHVSAVKANLRVRLCGLYGKPVDVEDFRAAQRGLQQVKMANLPQTRETEYF